MSYISLIKNYEILTFVKSVYPSVQLLFFMKMNPVFKRSCLRVFFESTEKIPQIIVTTFQTDFHHLQIRLFQKALG